jgi:hypothetical protein
MARQSTGNATFYKTTIFTADLSIHRSRTLLSVLRNVQYGFTVGLANGHLQGDPERRADRVSQVCLAQGPGTQIRDQSPRHRSPTP